MRIVKAIAAVWLALLLGACANGDRSSLAGWLQNLDPEQTQVSFWAAENDFKDIVLTREESQALIAILSNLSLKNLTENKHQAGITPEYGLRVAINNVDYNINQADAPRGQSEIHYRGKQWWIESKELQDFMRSFLNEKNK